MSSYFRGRLLLLAALTLGLQGCASIVSGTMQSVSVETPGCDGARCEITNDKGKWFVPSTPGSVTVGRSYNNLQVVCTKGGVTSTPVSAASATKGMAFGNILFGGVIGAGVDVSSGAAYDYPQTISVPMQCGAAAEGATPTSTAPPASNATRLGLRVIRATGAEPAGLLVTQVDPSSAAEKAGLKVGDVLMRANGSALPEPEALATLVAALREPWVLELTVLRESATSTVRIESAPRQIEL
jgi:membrane-associated protease RseP (regulator of RpoE activity)